nr:PREDICTED: G2/M phase-specific E3 ubiquitin-protein ligase-like isoform X1 [Bemisia tabaci]
MSQRPTPKQSQLRSLLQLLDQDPDAVEEFLSQRTSTEPVSGDTPRGLLGSSGLISSQGTSRGLFAGGTPRQKNQGNQLVSTTKLLGSKSKKTTVEPLDISFCRKLILLRDHNHRKVLTESEEAEHCRANNVCDSATFQTNWSEAKIKDHIRAIFNQGDVKKINNEELKILKIVKQSHLANYFLEPGAELNGRFLNEYSKGIIYISAVPSDNEANALVPKTGKVNKDPSFSASGSPQPSTSTTSRQCDYDVSHCLPKGRTIAFDSSESSDEDIFLPKKRPKETAKPITKTEHRSSDIYTDPNGRHWFFDDNGVGHELVDASTTTRRSVSMAIDMAKTRITGPYKLLTLRRSQVLQDLLQNLMECPSVPVADISMRLMNERGVGKGVMKEVMTLAMQEVIKSDLFEGNEYCKTLKKSIIAERIGEYQSYGFIIAFSIVHDGPMPTFFSPVLVDLIFNSDPVTATLDDVLNLHVKAQITALKQAENYADARSALADGEIFERAGTYQQLSESNWFEQREIAIKDAIEFYCIQNVREPARLLGFGLNRYYSLIDELKHCDMADVKQLFCHSHPKNAILSAKMMKELFKVSPEDAKTPAYKNWLRFLDELEKKTAAPGLELKDMLRFATGLDSVPPFGFKTSKPVIKIEPLLMPKGKICFNQLTLPSLNASYFEFKTMMETAMEFGSELDEA